MIILAIETSCDETAVAIIETSPNPSLARRGVKNAIPPLTKGRLGGVTFTVLANVVSSQIKLHAKYGGVVPALAAREHTKNIVPCIKKALKQANLCHSEPPIVVEGRLVSESLGNYNKIPIDLSQIDYFAVTAGPGLIPALLIGVSAAKTLAYFYNKPLIGINHIEAHFFVNWLSPINKISNSQFLISNIKFPALCLVISGGHTQLVLMKKFDKYEIIGETQDDAVGEAFDKVAKILGLPYPGGPIVSKLAENGNSNAIKFPRPMMYTKDFNFSFSGLKTAVLYHSRSSFQLPALSSQRKLGSRNNKELDSRLRGNDRDVQHDKIVADFCASFQQAAIDVLIHKTIKAAQQYDVKSVLLAGGVSANKELREQLQKVVDANLPKTTKLYIPKLEHCTDNAVMIAVAAYFHIKNKKPITNWHNIKANANLTL